MTNFSDSGIPGGGDSVPGAPNTVPGGQSITGSTPILSLQGGDFTLRSGPVVVNMLGFAEIQSNAEAYAKGIEGLRHQIAEKLALAMEEYAKANAPWEDRTGDARDQLKGVYIAEQAPNISAAVIAQGVEYGIYLETMQGGAFAILFPTVLHFVTQFASFAGSSDAPGDQI